jgi:hypothetical protein
MLPATVQFADIDAMERGFAALPRDVLDHVPALFFHRLKDLAGQRRRLSQARHDLISIIEDSRIPNTERRRIVSSIRPIVNAIVARPSVRSHFELEVTSHFGTL